MQGNNNNARRNAYASGGGRNASRQNSSARLEAERRRLREEERIKREKKETRKAYLGRFVVFLVVLAVILAVAGIIFLIVYHSTPDRPNDSGKITYYYGGRKIREADASEWVSGDGVYLCFNDLSDFAGFSESGGADELKFVIPGSVLPTTSAGDGTEEYISFRSGGAEVTINGQQARVTIPNILKNEEIWVSTEFVSEYVDGITVKYDEKDNAVRVSGVEDPETGGPVPITFKLKSEDPMPSQDGTVSPDRDPSVTDGGNTDTKIPENDGEVPKVTFSSDLSAYERYMDPEGAERDSYLTLVNRYSPLSADYYPPDLTYLSYGNVSGANMMRETAAYALEAMFIEMRADGYYGVMVSGAFTDYGYQGDLFSWYTYNEMAEDPGLTQEEAERIVETYCRRAGESESQTGLTVDMDTTGTQTVDFAYTDEYGWLRDNAWKFGFILRYPEDKTAVTGESFKPWHYRYVGRYHAYMMHSKNLCLEEYLSSGQTNEE